MTASGRKQIKGVQAQLFAETIRGFQWVEYYTFPKVMGLVERGWNAHPEWETLSGAMEQQAFDRDLALFYGDKLPFASSRTLHSGWTSVREYFYRRSTDTLYDGWD